MKNILSIFVLVGMCLPQMAYSQSREVVTSSAQAPLTPTTTATASVTTSTTMPPTIQTLANESAKNNNTGKTLAAAATVFATGMAIANCSAPPNPSCPMWKAGAIAGGIATAIMMLSSNQSNATGAAVTTAGDPNNSNPSTVVSDAKTAPPLPDYFNSPEWKAAQAKLEQYKKEGWTYDPATNQVTTPSGQKITPPTMTSSGLAAAGVSAKDIKGFEAEQAKAKASADKANKTVDNTDMYGDGIGGGGSKSQAVGYGIGGSADGQGLAAAGPKLGINRNPAQVAGMSKLYNGEPIGVAADSVFDMIDRRYQLHQQKGSFLLQGK
jgi:hypothetical protein